MPNPPEPYTDADVEVVAETLVKALGFSATPPTKVCYADARAVLDALTAKGWRPNPDATNHQGDTSA